MSFIVRPATEDDVAALATLAALTFPLACPPGHTLENMADHIGRVLSEEKFVDYATDNNFALFVATAGAELAGYSLVDFRASVDPDVLLSLANAGSYAELSKLYVHPDFHGAGIAQALRDSALEAMRTRAIATAWLTVNQLNDRANAFYEKSGFFTVATKKYLVGDVIDDDYLRVRALSPHEPSEDPAGAIMASERVVATSGGGERP